MLRSHLRASLLRDIYRNLNWTMSRLVGDVVAATGMQMSSS